MVNNALYMNEKRSVRVEGKGSRDSSEWTEAGGSN